MGPDLRPNGGREMTWTYLLLAIAFGLYHVRRIAAARVRQQPVAEKWTPPRDAPLVSFLVPAWDAAEHIPRFHSAFRDLTYSAKELVIAAGGADDSLEAAYAHAAQDVVVLEQHPGEGKQGALRRSFERCSGTIVYLSDIDSRPNDAVVHALLRQLIEDGADVATGPSRPLDWQLDNEFVRVQWAVDQASQPTATGPSQGLLGRNAVLTRVAVEATGGFANPAPSGTDYTLAKELLRCGYSIVFVPASPMPTEYPPTFHTYVRKQARWVRNVFVLGRRYGAVQEWRAASVTIALPFALIGLAFAGFMGYSPAAFLATIGVAHALANRSVHLRRARLRASPAAILMHFAADQLAAMRACWHALRGVTPW